MTTEFGVEIISAERSHAVTDYLDQEDEGNDSVTDFIIWLDLYQ